MPCEDDGIGQDGGIGESAHYDEFWPLTRRAIRQIQEKVAEAMRIGYAEVTLVIEKGRLRWIRGPSPSEPVRD